MTKYINADLLLEDFKGRAKYADKWVNECSEEIKPRAEATRAFINEVIMTIQQAPSVEEDQTIPKMSEDTLAQMLVDVGIHNSRFPEMTETRIWRIAKKFNKAVKGYVRENAIEALELLVRAIKACGEGDENG